MTAESQLYRSDVARALTANVVAILATAQAYGGGNLEFERGVMVLAQAQALDYGIPWPTLQGEVARALGDGVRLVEGGGRVLIERTASGVLGEDVEVKFSCSSGKDGE